LATGLEKKKQVVSELAEIASNASSAVVAEYRGLSVDEMSSLRKQAKDAGVYLKVVKNTLAKKAFQETNFACMTDKLVGPLVYAFSQDDPGSAARVINNFSKKNELLGVRLVALNGELYEASDITKIANLPTFDEGVSIIMSLMKAPIEKLTRTIGEPHVKLARSFSALKTLKEVAN
jgi:large subunit ribosomal protein L10